MSPLRAGEGVGGGVNSLDGQIRFSSYLGAATLYLVEVGDGTILKVAEPNAGGLARFRPGEAVQLSWPPEAVMVFAEAA